MFNWITENLNKRPTVNVGAHPAYSYVPCTNGMGSGWFVRDASPGSQ